MEERSFDEKRHAACRMFMLTDRLHRKAVEKFAAQLGIHRSQHFVLMRIAASGGCVSQKELAKKLEISPAALAVTLKKLENGGYLEKKPDEGDSRLNEIRLTEKGREIYRLSAERFSGIDRKMFSGISDVELEQFISILARMQSNLQADMEPSE